MDADSAAHEPDAHGARLLDAGALRALAHPLRVEMFDILSQFGPQTASSLAEMTGQSSGLTSYHLRALAKHDLIREVTDRGTARERWWERPRGGVSLTNPAAMSSPAGVAATQIVMSEFLTRRHQQLMRYVTQSLSSAEALETAEAMISTATVRLTPEQRDDFAERVQAVIDECVKKYRDQNVEGAKAYSVRADIFPLTEERSS